MSSENNTNINQKPTSNNAPRTLSEKITIFAKNSEPISFDKDRNAILNGKIINKPHTAKLNLPRDFEQTGNINGTTKSTEK
ncbi:hypothetical protein QEN19_003791 [Hanseniaspora menglaensis]